MLYANISAFQKDGWERAERKNDDFISQFIKGMSISSVTKDGMFAHSLSAFEALKNDIDANGFKLSDRVWNITQQTKSQLEFYLDSGVVAGRNANGISSDIRQILQNPQKRFRRIRNEKGELVLSQPMTQGKGFIVQHIKMLSGHLQQLRTLLIEVQTMNVGVNRILY